MTAPTSSAHATLNQAAAATRPLGPAMWAMLIGNFFIGCGVMLVAGGLNDLVRDLAISVAQGGHLIAVAALMMGLGAPALASVVAKLDRRTLLTASLIWYAAGHALSAMAPTYAWLLPVRALTVLGAAVFTPQAAATVGLISAPEHRGRHITFIFMGWSIASVIGMPMAAWVGDHLGWRVAAWGVAAGTLGAAVWLHRTLPAGIRTGGLPWRRWRRVLRSPLLMAVVLVTACQSAGQYTTLAYAAPYFKQVFHANTEQISLMFGWFGALALTGNVLLSRFIHRIGAAQAVTTTLMLMWVSMAIWPWATSLSMLAWVVIPWSISGFATNSGQQARLSGLSIRLAPALMALNTSGIYLGHAIGASGGAWVLSHGGFTALPRLGMVWLTVAIALSWWALAKQRGGMPRLRTHHIKR